MKATLRKLIHWILGPFVTLGQHMNLVTAISPGDHIAIFLYNKELENTKFMGETKFMNQKSYCVPSKNDKLPLSW